MKISKQEDFKDCGLCVLQYFVQKLHNKTIEMDYLKIQATYGPEGINLSNLKDIANNVNLRLSPYNGDFDSIFSLKKEDFPIVLLINKNGLLHYVVLEKIKKDIFYIQDPEFGKIVKYSYNELESLFANLVIFIEKDEKNQSSNKKYKVKNSIKAILSDKKYTYPLLVVSLLNTILTFAFTFFIKIVFDIILPNYLKSSLIIVFIFFAWINILRFVNIFFKNLVIKKIENNLEMDLTNVYLSKFQNCSLDTLNKVSQTEFIKRLGYIPQIAQFYASFAHLVFSELFSFIVSMLLLIWINYILFFIVIVISLIPLCINFLNFIFLDKKYLEFVNQSTKKMQSDLDIIYATKSMNESTAHNYLFAKQVANFNGLKQTDYSFFTRNNGRLMINNLLIGNLSLIIVFVSSFLILKNQLSTGNLMMFLTSVNFFIDPLTASLEILLNWTIIRNNDRLVNFVINLNEKENINKFISLEIIKNIELKNVEFAYETGKKVLKINKLSISKNSFIKGNNGSGKTTLLNILNGQYTNFLGKILINNHELKNLNWSKFSNDIFFYTPSVYFPKLSLLEFITLNKAEHIKELNINIEKYNLAEAVAKINLNLNSNLLDNGSNLSAGQKQFACLLKLFTKKYKLILLDEIFENLDMSLYKKIAEAIKDYQQEAMVLEISHSGKYIHNGEEINLDKINKNK